MLEEYFQTPVEGAIYAEIIDRLRAQGAIQRAEVDNSALVHTAWDLGSPLNTVTWFFQIVGPEIRIVDCDSDLDLTPVQRVARMLAKGYFYGSHFLPHDAQVTQKSGKTFLTELNELGLRNCKAVPQTYDIWIGINRLRQLLPRFTFRILPMNADWKRYATITRSGPLRLALLLTNRFTRGPATQRTHYAPWRKLRWLACSIAQALLPTCNACTT